MIKEAKFCEHSLNDDSGTLRIGCADIRKERKHSHIPCSFSFNLLLSEGWGGECSEILAT